MSRRYDPFLAELMENAIITAIVVCLWLVAGRFVGWLWHFLGVVT